MLALIAVVAFLYYPGLSGGFFFDDRPNIVDNSSLRLFDGSFSSLISASVGGAAGPLGRPFSVASFALNLHFFGDGPFSFKCVNLLIHLANGLLVFILAQQLLPRLTGGDKASPAAIWVAAVWLLHPINLTPALFVVQRMTSLAAFFSFAALCLYLYGRQTAGNKGRLAIAAGLLVCWPAAILSKETGLLLPLFILLCEWLALDSFRSIPRRIFWLGAFIAGLTVAGICMAEWHIVTAGYRLRDFTLAERLMTESRVLWFYLSQLLLPWPDFFSLHHDDFQISRGLLVPTQTLWAIIGWVSLAALAVYHHKRAPLPAFALLWFMAAHTLESTILPLEIAYEHRNYMASLGVFICLAGFLFAPQSLETAKTVRIGLAAAFVISCALVTTLRATQWGDEYRRTQMEAAAHPGSARASYEAGVAAMERIPLVSASGKALAYQTAQLHLKRAAELDGNSKAALMGLLYLDCVAARPKDMDIQAQLRERFSTGLFPPGDLVIVQSLSRLLIENRLCLNDDEVKALLDAALSNPKADGAMRGMLNAVGMDYAAAKMHSLPLALAYAKAAVASNPGNVGLRINLVYVLLASGDQTASRKEYAILANLPVAPQDKPDFEQLSRKIIGMERNANKR